MLRGLGMLGGWKLGLGMFGGGRDGGARRAEEPGRGSWEAEAPVGNRPGDVKGSGDPSAAQPREPVRALQLLPGLALGWLPDFPRDLGARGLGDPFPGEQPLWRALRGGERSGPDPEGFVPLFAAAVVGSG